jgi:hypothetical protein
MFRPEGYDPNWNIETITPFNLPPFPDDPMDNPFPDDPWPGF